MLERYVEALVDAVPPARDGNERAVHQARVASRRLREALPVLAATHGAGGGEAVRRARKRVRRVTRALGPVRELDVALTHLAEYEARGAAAPAAIAVVRRDILRAREARRAAMLASLTPGRLEKLRRPLAEVEAAPLEPAAAGAASARRIVGRAVRLAAAIDAAGGLYLPDRLHAVRIAVKKLRYALEVQREIRPSRATARIGQLKAVQDLLGRIHDLEILIEHVRAAEAREAGTNRRVALDLAGLVRTLEHECRARHAAYMARRAALLRACEAVRAVMAAHAA